MEHTLPNKKTDVKRAAMTAALVFLAAGCCALFFIPETLLRDDTFFHVLRIEYLVDAMKQGDIFPAIFPDAYDGYGYALPLFYCDFFIYIPALLTLAGLPVLLSYKIYEILLLSATVFTAYTAAKNIFGDRLTGVFAACLYTGSAYLAADLMERDALGEVQAFVFAPIVLLGIYRSVYGERKRNIPLIIGFLGLALSHFLSLAMFAVFFLAFLVFNLRRLVKEPKRIASVLLCAGCVVLLSAFFLLPFAEQMLTTGFFSSYHARIFNPETAAVGLRNIFFTVSEDGYYTPPIGITMLAALALRVFFPLKARGDTERFRDLCLGGGIACIFMSTRFFPWRALDPYLNLIQFPWRFYLPGTLFLSVAGALMLKELIKKKGGAAKTIAVFAVAVVCIAQFMYVALPEFVYQMSPAENDRYSGLITDTDEFILWDENYLNENNDRGYWAERPGTASGVNGEMDITLGRDYKVTTAKFSGNTAADNSIELPLVYYLGYSAKMLDGEELPVSVSDKGLVEVDVGPMSEGTVRVEYTGTLMQKTAPLVTVAFILFLAARETVLLKRKKNAQKAVSV